LNLFKNNLLDYLQDLIVQDYLNEDYEIHINLKYYLSPNPIVVSKKKENYTKKNNKGIILLTRERSLLIISTTSRTNACLLS